MFINEKIISITNTKVDPVLKWVGGKSRLYKQIQCRLPKNLVDGKIKNYYEPFFGGGAIFFNLVQNYKFEKCVLSDINEELILFYIVVKRDVCKLINYTERYLQQYSLLSQLDKEKFYYDLRKVYNMERLNINYKDYSGVHILRAAQMLFLNKTCYNGIYRQNSTGGFNTPFGKVYTPPTLRRDNLMNASNAFKCVDIRCDDFQDVCESIYGSDSFVYLDPPYKNNFTNYNRTTFSNDDQLRLANIYKELNARETLLMMNNSSLKEVAGVEPVEDYYKEFNIEYLESCSTISSNISTRKKIQEIIITNY